MGNCGSAPAVQDNPPPPKPKPLSARVPSQKESLSVPSSVPSSNSPIGQLPIAALSARSNNQFDKKNDLANVARNSKSVEPFQVARSVETSGQKQDSAAEDEDDAEDSEGDGEWKVRRRVSRRLSLEVQKRQGSKTGSNSPAWETPPTASDEAAWEAAAESDLMNSAMPAGRTYTASSLTPAGPVGTTESKSHVASGDSGRVAATGIAGNVRGGGAEPGQQGGPGSDAILLQGSAGVLSTGRSMLGRESASGALDGADGVEGEEEGFWRVKRRGRQRRLSLETNKPPDLAILAAIKRPSPSATISKKAVNKEGSGRQTLLGLSPNLVVDSRLSSLVASSNVGKGNAESAVTSPATHSARVIDFAHSFTRNSDTADEIEDEMDGSDTPSSVKTAEALVKGSSDGSPNKLRVKRRASRRLSLEIDNKPDEAVLAAVRRTHSTPVTAEAAAKAMGAAAWAEVVGGGGGGGTHGAISLGESPGYSPQFEPKQEREGSVRADITEAQDMIMQARSSSQESTVGDLPEPVIARETSQKRALDVYEKAIIAGESHVNAAKLAGLDPSATKYDTLRDEEIELMMLQSQDPVKGVEKAGFKSRWADYSSDELASGPSPLEETVNVSRRYPDMSAFGNESQPAPSPSPSLAGISV